MQWNDHSKLKGQHSFMSPSQGAWVEDNDEEFLARYSNWKAKEKGTELHAGAAYIIELFQDQGLKVANNHSTLAMYINDAIGFKMKVEQPLYYSEYCYGTADSIIFVDAKKLLRIHDLKTGKTPAHMRQLYIYAALFCLEYNHRPGDIKIETRIYQNDNIIVDKPGADIILPIMDSIVHKNKLILQKESQEPTGGIGEWIQTS